MLRAYLNRNIVMVRHPETGRLKFVQMYAALFGQGSSVYSFERWSAFLEAGPIGGFYGCSGSCTSTMAN